MKGIGVHTGSIGEVLFSKSRAPLRLQIQGLSFQENNLVPFVQKAHYGTVLEDSCVGSSFSTPEHLIAVLSAYSFLELSVECYGNELPIGDGSGLPFLNELKKVWGKPLPSPYFKEYSTNLSKVYYWENGSMEVSPSEHFEVHYEWNRDGISEQAHWSSLDGESFLKNIVPARTFITWKNFLNAKKQGLLKGVPSSWGYENKSSLSEGVGILLAETIEEYTMACEKLGLGGGSGFPYVYRQGVLTKSECARHKILDLVGDLALLSLKLPKLSCQIVNGGHYQHHQLLRDLLDEQHS